MVETEVSRQQTVQHVELPIPIILGRLAFSASGLIAMGAGVISTVLSVPGYQFLYWNYDGPMAQKHGGNMMLHLKSKWFQTIKDFFTLVYKILRIITFPIWGTRWAVTKLKTIKAK